MADSHYTKFNNIDSKQAPKKIKLIDNGDDTFSIAVASGTSGRSAQIEGRRYDISEGASDIWEGQSEIIPIPSPAGQRMAIKSTNIADIAGGDGVREVAIEYVDVNGDAQIEIVAMNGTTEVLTAATDIIMINDFYATKNGNIANNNTSSALGDITIYEIGDTSLIYNVIKEGNNKSSSTLRMIPNNTVYQIDALIVSGDTKGITVNLRVNESDTGVETEGFLYRIPMTIGDSPAPITFPTSIRVSAGRLIKATATVPSQATGGDVSYLISGRLDTVAPPEVPANAVLSESGSPIVGQSGNFIVSN